MERLIASYHVDDPSKVDEPKPTDFDEFLPWACRKLCVDIDVIVIRGARRMDLNASGRIKKIKRKSSIQQTSFGTPDNGSDEDSSVTHKSTVFDDEYDVKIETIYDRNDNLVQLKFLKNKKIPRQIMQTIALTIPYQQQLTSVNINSGLCMEALYELAKFLPKSNITEINLDGTNLKEANYHLLLTNGNLKYLSLAKCMINDTVVKTITDLLTEPYRAAKVLTALNLSSNRITDVGAKYIADMLRTNRQLCYLNLAGNMITDEGGMRILDTLHEFPLLPQELLDSRAQYIAYLKKRNELKNAFIIELQTAKFEKYPKKKTMKKGKMDNSSLQQLTEKSLVETAIEAQITQEKAEYLANKKLGLYKELFSSKNTKTRDGVVYCFGNNTLCYLNFAYNNLTYVSVKKLYEVLSTQKARNRTPIGLIRVVIEGNLVPVACKEYEEIDRILISFRRNSEVTMKKRALSTKSVNR